MTEFADMAKDSVILLVGGGAAWTAISKIISAIKGNHENKQSVTITSSANNSNGKSYATSAELAAHALTCAGGIHEKINQNYTNLSDQINSNHKESMKTFADLQVSMARLESMKRGS